MADKPDQSSEGDATTTAKFVAPKISSKKKSSSPPVPPAPKLKRAGRDIPPPPPAAGRTGTLDKIAAYQDGPQRTSPAIVISQARAEATVTGLGVVHGVTTAMVGRDQHLKQLVDTYKKSATEQECSVVALSGEPGVGCTRLVIEMLETCQASAYPFILMTCFGSAGKQDRSRDVLQRLLVSRLRIPTAEASVPDRTEALKARVEELFDPRDEEWALNILSAFYELPPPANLIRQVQALRTDRAALRLATRELVERLVRRECEQCPVVLWFDDLEYDDADGLIELCEMLVRLGDVPVLTVLVGEGADIVPAERLQMAGISFETIGLERLNDDLAGELVRDILRFCDPLPSDLVAMIVAKAQGLPLAIEQLVRLLIDSGVVTTGEYAWTVNIDKLMEPSALPSTVEELARVRVEALSSELRHVLEIAAMLGATFELRDVVQVMRLEPMDYDEVPWFSDARETWVREQLLELMGREVITLRRDSGNDDESTQLFEFRFASERQFLLAQIDPAPARTVHGIFARMLRDRNAEPARVAQHLEAAGLHKQAAARWVEVGQAAEKAFFNHSALDAFTHALEFFGPEDGDGYIDLLVNVGRLARRVGQLDVSLAAFLTAIQTTFVFEDQRRAIRGFRGLGESQIAAGHYVDAETSFRRAHALAEKMDRKHAIAACQDQIATSMYEVGDPGACAEAIKILEGGLEIRRAIGNPKGTADTLEAIGVICIARGDLNRALACFTEAINARRAVNDWHGLASTLVHMAGACRKLGRRDVAQAHVEEALEVAERTGELGHRLRALITHADFALRDGNFGSAGEFLSAGVALIDQLVDRPSQILCLLMRARWRVATSDLAGAFEDARLAVATAEEGESKRQLGIALNTLAVIQAAMIRERVQPRPSLTQTRDRFLESQRMLEDMGNWHGLAESLRAYGEFLLDRGKKDESKRCFTRAEALDPLSLKN